MPWREGSDFAAPDSIDHCPFQAKAESRHARQPERRAGIIGSPLERRRTLPILRSHWRGTSGINRPPFYAQRLSCRLTSPELSRDSCWRPRRPWPCQLPAVRPVASFACGLRHRHRPNTAPPRQPKACESPWRGRGGGRRRFRSFSPAPDHRRRQAAALSAAFSTWVNGPRQNQGPRGPSALEKISAASRTAIG